MARVHTVTAAAETQLKQNTRLLADCFLSNLLGSLQVFLQHPGDLETWRPGDLQERAQLLKTSAAKKNQSKGLKYKNSFSPVLSTTHCFSAKCKAEEETIYNLNKR